MSKEDLTFRPLKMTIRCHRTLASDYPMMQHHIPEQNPPMWDTYPR